VKNKKAQEVAHVVNIRKLNKKNEFVKEVLRWYNHNRKSYPWRLTKNPYKILTTEMLLRKTTRMQVKRVFPIFFKKFPTVKSLAHAEQKEIEKIVTSLGMERTRSKLLLDVAKTISKTYHGTVPTRKEDLLNLPGVGEYTASAVLLLTKSEKHPLVDTNSKRVIERIFIGEKTSRRVDRETRDFVSLLLPEKQFVEFNLAILDFAASVCTSRNPRCGTCPLTKICLYYRNNTNFK